MGTAPKMVVSTRIPGDDQRFIILTGGNRSSSVYSAVNHILFSGRGMFVAKGHSVDPFPLKYT